MFPGSLNYESHFYQLKTFFATVPSVSCDGQNCTTSSNVYSLYQPPLFLLPAKLFW